MPINRCQQDLFRRRAFKTIAARVYEHLYKHICVTFGGSVTHYALTIGLYLFSMGLGASSFKFLKKFPVVNIISLEIVLSVVGATAIFMLYSAALLFLEDYRHALVFGYLLIVVIGFLSGLEIPFLVWLDQGKRFTRVLAFDFIDQGVFERQA